MEKVTNLGNKQEVDCFQKTVLWKRTTQIVKGPSTDLERQRIKLKNMLFNRSKKIRTIANHLK